MTAVPDNLAAMGADPATSHADRQAILVSFIVRSMGRPELRATLESIARQDHASIEVVIVDATGGRHPPLPDIAWAPGHVARVVSNGIPLKRPQAAMLGLESVRGEWFMFLDDDDTCEPAHVSSLLRAASRHPSALLVYGCGRLHDERGRLVQVFGRPFNRALMHYGPLFYWQSAILSTRIRELGCGFDPELEVCEDRDFLARIAEHGDFVFEPGIATFNYRPDLGTSGTGQGANRNAVRVARYESLLRAKWAGPGVYHNERVATLCRNAVHAFFEGDLDRSQSTFERALDAYPDDPNALHGLGRVRLARGDFAMAERVVRRAIEVNPLAGEYHATLAEILARSGSTPVSPLPPELSRTSPCPCRSGLRYKACCGRIGAIAAPPASGVEAVVAREPLLGEVESLLARGEASRAQALLDEASRDPQCARVRLVAAARLALALDDAPTALSPMQRAVDQGIDTEVGLMLEDCCARLAREHAGASLWRKIRQLCISSARSAASHADDSIAIAVAPNALPAVRSGASVLRSSLLEGSRDTVVEFTTLASPRACSTLIVWDAADMAWPRGDASPRRVVVRLERDDPGMLLRALARLELRWPDATLSYTLPHAGIDGDAAQRIDYPWIGGEWFRVEAATPTDSLRVGVHATASPDQRHPDDGSFYRGLLAENHRLALPSTPFLRTALDGAPLGERIAWFDADVPITALDVVVVRGDPCRGGWADPRVLEAMAAARPVIAFAGSLGAREWIEDGVSGFVVHSQADAMARLSALAASPALRSNMGAAARRVARRIVHEQAARARMNYFDVSVNV